MIQIKGKERYLPKASAESQNLMNYLQRLKYGWCSDPYIKDTLHVFKLKISILFSKWRNERVLEILVRESQQLGTEPRRLSGDGPAVAVSDLEKLRFIKPEMAEMYSAVFTSSTSCTLESYKDVSWVHRGFSKNILFTFAEVVAVNAAYLLHFLRLEKNMDEEILCNLKIELLDIVVKIRPLQLHARRIYRQALQASKLREVIIDAGCLMYSPIFNQNEFISVTFPFVLERFAEKIKFIKRECRGFLSPISSINKFPTTNELEFIDFILKNLEERLHCKSASVDLLESHIKTVYEGLEALRHIFGANSGPRNNNERFSALFTRYKDVAYLAEYFVDLSPSEAVLHRYQPLGLVQLTEKIGHIQEEVKAIINNTKVHNIAPSSSCASSQDNPWGGDEMVNYEVELGNKRDKAIDQLVGLEDEVKVIIEQLTRGSKQLKILSIVGMPGVGKTTLASSVYNDPLVTKFFHLRAWSSLSQVYKAQTVLSEILHEITEQTNQNCGTNASCLVEKVYKSLKGNRYLIVIDDIWVIEAWNVLKVSFPNDNNGSRIIFTTREHAVAFQAKSVPHALRLLSDEESWKLLQVKLFKEETCPPELLLVGKWIAEDCKGLPLSVVLIAGLLKMTERKQSCWEEVQKRFRSHNSLEHHLRALELSYKQLPDYLKPCFLYFGAFREDTEIPAKKLAQLWIAKGFVQPTKVGQNSPEDEAENYLNNFVDRSLVMIAKRSTRGELKACRIHDLLHDFCLARAKQENFLLAMDKSGESSRFHDYEVYQQYRLSIHCNMIPQVSTGYFESLVRTLLISESRGIYEGCYAEQTPGWFGSGYLHIDWMRNYVALML